MGAMSKTTLVAATIAVSAGLFQGAFGPGCGGGATTPEPADVRLRNAIHGQPDQTIANAQTILTAQLAPAELSHLEQIDWSTATLASLKTDATFVRAVTVLKDAGAMTARRRWSLGIAEASCASAAIAGAVDGALDAIRVALRPEVGGAAALTCAATGPAAGACASAAIVILGTAAAGNALGGFFNGLFSCVVDQCVGRCSAAIGGASCSETCGDTVHSIDCQCGNTRSCSCSINNSASSTIDGASLCASGMLAGWQTACGFAP
jgi:hypothetical protein